MRVLAARCGRSLGLVLLLAPSATGLVAAAEGRLILVKTTGDTGPGSLRQAIIDASASIEPVVIRFDSEEGPFRERQVIRLASELPALTRDITIDGRIEGRLWQAIGVEISGEGGFRVFTVGRGAHVSLEALTLARGSAPDGGAILTRGRLVVKDTTLVENSAAGTGGAILQEEGELFVINSTLARNRAGSEGGAVAAKSGRATVTNATFSENAAPRAGGLLAAAASTLLVRNTILANSAEGADCVRLGELDAGSTHNLIEQNEGCGTPLSTADPLLAPLGLYNGPTPTLPLDSRSPALNWGDNASAVDENGERLVWDQRGNGDPRDVAGITDIGAFESQYKVDLTVDTPVDDDRRGCTPSVPEDCSLRGALALANASPRLDRIRFDPAACGPSHTLVVNRPLPEVTAPLTLDASPCGSLALQANGHFSTLPRAEGVELTLVNLALKESPKPAP